MNLTPNYYNSGVQTNTTDVENQSPRCIIKRYPRGLRHMVKSIVLV